MSLTTDPTILVLTMTVGGFLLLLAGAFVFLRRPRPAGIRLAPRLLMLALAWATGAGAIWTGLYQVQSGGEHLPSPSALELPERTAPSENTGDLVFYRDVNLALSRSRESGRPLLIDFFAEWCDPCHRWNRMATENETLHAALGRAVLARVYDTDPAFAAFQEHPAHGPLRIGLPYFVILDATGRIRYQSNDYRDREGMIAALESASSAKAP